MIHITFCTACPLVYPVFIPKFQLRVGDGIPALHFPRTEMQFFKPLVNIWMFVTAEGCQLAATCQRTAIDCIEKCIFYAGADLFRFFRERGRRGYIAPALTNAGFDIYARVSDKCKFHRNSVVVMKKPK